MSTNIGQRPNQEFRAAKTPQRGEKNAAAARADLLARAAAVPSAKETREPSRAARTLDVERASARADQIKTRPESAAQALNSAKAFLYARERQKQGPPLSAEEETWWLLILNQVRGYDALADFQTRHECFSDVRTRAAIKTLRGYMQRIRELDLATRERERGKLPPSCVFNFPDRMGSVIYAATQSLQKPLPPEKQPARRVPSPAEVTRALGQDNGPAGSPEVWIGQSHGAYSPGLGNTFVPAVNGTMIAVPK